jgi:hypothetical protein
MHHFFAGANGSTRLYLTYPGVPTWVTVSTAPTTKALGSCRNMVCVPAVGVLISESDEPWNAGTMTRTWQAVQTARGPDRTLKTFDAALGARTLV